MRAFLYSNNEIQEIRCLSLWFYIQTNDLAVLKITQYTNETENIIESRVGGYGEKWHFLSTHLNTTQSSTVEISATVKNGLIAIDDIQLSSASCQNASTNIIACTFEDKDDCGIIENTNGSLWRVMTAAASNTSLISADHTQVDRT